MLKQLKSWKGIVVINDRQYDSIEDVQLDDIDGKIHVQLYPKAKETYRITVKRYMTQKSSPNFNFMEKWNQNNPMPLCTMVGEVLDETRGMIKMKLNGDVYAEKIHTCMKCGKALTNKVSQYFGIGPECGGHNYVSPFDSEQELKEAVESYRKELQKVTWTGWIIKSAIIEKDEV